MGATKKATNQTDTAVVNGLVSNARAALDEMLNLTQQEVDSIVQDMALAGMEAHMKLAKMAVQETGRGVYEDKITKNIFATEYILNSIRDVKTVGVISDNEHEDFMKVAEPLGVIAGVTPVTNPTSTTMFKCIIALKTRNPIIFAFHPSAQQCSMEAAKILLDAAVRAAAPKNAIQWIEKPSLEATQSLMNHKDVALILATGGSGMVKAAYSSGKPALGVGPGNVPCYIEKSANVKRAATDLILSKTFDNGMICASEQAVIVDKEIQAEFEAFMKEHDCAFLTDIQIKKLENVVINQEKQALNPKVVGQSAYTIAQMADIDVPKTTKILIAHQKGVGAKYPLSREKLSPVLAYFVVDGYQEGVKRADEMVRFGGMGHSAVVHTNDQKVIDMFADTIKVGRVIVNQPSSHGGIGDLYNTNTPSLTLGCGSYGNNSTTSNVSVENLINVKRVAKRRVNMQWFKIPPKVYFEYGSIQYLRDMPDISRAFIVTDELMVKLGYADKVIYQLRQRDERFQYEIFDQVEPDPSVDTIIEGANRMRAFEPDVIIALGGGSAMDAAKGMWLYYEKPDTDFNNMHLKFMDIRKRTYRFPKIGNKAKLVCVPTTSGTGSEVTSFAVVTDKKKNVKYPLADYELTPDVAIIDPNFVKTVPKTVTADTGMDVLTHAIEAFVSVFASDYTDALALRAIQLVFEYLPKAYENPEDEKSREKMHNASCMAGMAFTNAFLGINHSMAHKLGGEFHIPHGRANAVLLPHVIAYNASKPTKFVAFPKYEKFIADEKYAEIARALNLPAKDTKQGVNSLVEAVKTLMEQIGVPNSISACGVDKKKFMAVVDDLADKAFEDQCTPVNPRMPLVEEIKELYIKAF